MNNEIEVIPSGTVTSPKGFQAGTVSAGIKESATDKLDLGILFSEAPCTAAAVFTSNRIKAASVILSQQRLQNGKAVAVVANSGCANACVGEPGMADTIEMAELAAGKVGVSPDDVLVASTGVIGSRLPM
ncbi:bifunctional ornithine acetyltransferase/N-acetylglutamate synthase, partial [Chloroflexota bacterium]